MPLVRDIFPDPLDVRAMDMAGGRRLWYMLARFRVRTSLGEIEVPGGFITDLASTPRILWTAFAPTDEYLYAAIPHDFLYSEHNDRFTRLQADRIMLELMYNLGIPWPRRHAVYNTVRLFGGRSWKAKTP